MKVTEDAISGTISLSIIRTFITFAKLILAIWRRYMEEGLFFPIEKAEHDIEKDGAAKIASLAAFNCIGKQAILSFSKALAL